MEETDFLHDDTNARKLKVTVPVIGWARLKMCVMYQVKDSKICWMSRMHKLIELIFSMVMQIQEC